MIAMVDSASLSLAQSAASQTSLDLRTTSDTLGANARQAMIDIFRKKDADSQSIGILASPSYSMIRTSLMVLLE